MFLEVVTTTYMTYAPSVFMQVRCNFPDISYLSETQKNNVQFLKNTLKDVISTTRRYHTG